MHLPRKFGKGSLISGVLCFFIMCLSQVFGQTVTINGAGTGRLFDGVGAVSGGGATSPMLKDYAEPYRSQILDYLFKPKFGASMNTLFFEIPGDDNATQGSEPSHMHTANDLNYQRGYEWWLIKQAKSRNPSLTLDGVAWGSPGWVGNGSFWSTDMQNYYLKWIQGLKSTYGYNMDGIGCRNEWGTNDSWLTQFKALLTSNNITAKVHGFDENGATKWDFVNDFATNAAFKNAIDVCSAHATGNGSAPVPAAALNSGKLLWDTEEHAYYAGYTCEQYIVHDVNANYITNSKITKTVFWYLIEAYYSVEQFTNQTMAVANQPWSGHYQINPALWGYAHYDQFVDVGWQFIDAACGNVTGGGTYATLKSPGNTDISVIIETQNGAGGTLNFTISGGLPSTKPLCVWMSNSTNQFVKQADITPVNGAFSITVAGNSIYSISTTTGQQKGTFSTAIPASQAFPVPFYENYDHYTGTDAKLWGYLPYYTCDICGVFEIANSPTGTGKCLRQVLTTKASSWAPEWATYTLIGNVAGTNYEVSADVYFDNNGWAGVMGRVNQTGTYGCFPRGYYLRLSSTGAWNLGYANGAAGDGSSLASGTATLTGTGWHNVKLQMSGSTLTCFIENKQVTNPAVSNGSSGNGVAGLYAGTTNGGRNTACFDNLIINAVNGATPAPTVFAQDATPPYAATTIVAGQPIPSHAVPVPLSYKVVSGQFVMPKEFAGKNVAALVYDLKGRLMKKVITTTAAINLGNSFNKANEVFIVKLNVVN